MSSSSLRLADQYVCSTRVDQVCLYGGLISWLPELNQLWCWWVQLNFRVVGRYKGAFSPPNPHPFAPAIPLLNESFCPSLPPLVAILSLSPSNKLSFPSRHSSIRSLDTSRLEKPLQFHFGGGASWSDPISGGLSLNSLIFRFHLGSLLTLLIPERNGSKLQRNLSEISDISFQPDSFREFSPVFHLESFFSYFFRNTSSCQERLCSQLG